jgi:hypothetical protein
VIFPSVHPRYSYVRLDDQGFVTEAAQKNPISHHATTGIFWYRRTGDFRAAVESMIRKDAHVKNHFYVCLAFNEMLLEQAKVGVIQIEPSQYFPIKTEQQLHRFEHITRPEQRA